MADNDPVTTSLLTLAPTDAFSGEIHFGSAAGGMLALRGPSTSDTGTLIFPEGTPNNGDYLRANSAGQLYFDAGCSACGGSGNGGGFTDPGVNGILVRSGPDTYISRSIVGQYPITVLNGDGAAGNPAIGLTPGTVAGQVLTWDGTHWAAAASSTTPGGGGGTPNVLIRWLNTTGGLQDSALSQDATGTTVNAGGAFVVSGRLQANNLFVFPTPTIPFAPPTTFGEGSKALIYYQGGAVPLWVSYSATGGTGGWQPINAFRIGRVPGGSFSWTNKVSVGKTGMLIGDPDTTGGEFDSEIYLSPLTAASGDVGKAIVWDGTQWVASPAPIGLAGTGVTVGGGGGAINVFPVWSASNVLINSSPTGTGIAGGLKQGPIGGGSLNYFLQSTYDIFVSDNAIRLGSYLRMDGGFTSVAQSDPGTARLWYNYASFPDTILVSYHGGQYQAINAITMAQPGKTPITSAVWALTPPLQSLRSGSDVILRIAPPPVNLTAGQLLTWDGAQWIAQFPGTSTSGVVTASGGTQGFIPLFTTITASTNTIGNSALFQNASQEILSSAAIIAGGRLKGLFLDITKPVANFPPNQPGVAPDTNTARIVYFGGNQLQVSMGGQPYVTIATGTFSGGVIGQTPFTAGRLTKWSTAGTGINDANLFDTGTAIAIGPSTPGGTYQFVPSAGVQVDLGLTSNAFRSLVVSTATVGFLHTLASPLVPGVGGGSLAAPAITLSDPTMGLYATSPDQIVMGIKNFDAMLWQNDINNPIYLRVAGVLRQVTMGGLDPAGSGKHCLVV